MKTLNSLKMISNVKPFINEYNWKEINFPAEPKD